MTSIMAAFKGERDIAIGNAVGSNVFNILCVLGVTGLVSPEPLLAGVQMARVDLPIMLGVAVLCMPLFFTGAILDRIEGALFQIGRASCRERVWGAWARGRGERRIR